MFTNIKGAGEDWDHKLDLVMRHQTSDIVHGVDS